MKFRCNTISSMLFDTLIFMSFLCCLCFVCVLFNFTLTFHSYLHYSTILGGFFLLNPSFWRFFLWFVDVLSIFIPMVSIEWLYLQFCARIWFLKIISNICTGGWGWIVCGVAFLAHVLTTGFQLSYGLLYLFATRHLGKDVATETSKYIPLFLIFFDFFSLT